MRSLCTSNIVFEYFQVGHSWGLDGLSSGQGVKIATQPHVSYVGAKRHHPHRCESLPVSCLPEPPPPYISRQLPNLIVPDVYAVMICWGVLDLSFDLMAWAQLLWRSSPSRPRDCHRFPVHNSPEASGGYPFMQFQLLVLRIRRPDWDTGVRKQAPEHRSGNGLGCPILLNVCRYRLNRNQHSHHI